MRIIAVDDEELTVDCITDLLRRLEPEAEVTGFTEAEDAFDYLAKHPVDIALLDIEMGEYSGIALAKKCKDMRPQINIIFVTGYDQYAMEALALHASGYLMKPIRESALRKELENLRHPLPRESAKEVTVQTFGNFEVFVNQKPLHMPIAKCRECLAYLVDRRGARITVPELAALLYEDEPYCKKIQNRVYRVVTDTIDYLKAAGIEGIILKNRKELAIDTEKIDCDYYRFLAGDVSAMNAFLGEYMSNYTWAEFTLAELARSNLKA